MITPYHPPYPLSLDQFLFDKIEVVQFRSDPTDSRSSIINEEYSNSK